MKKIFLILTTFSVLCVPLWAAENFGDPEETQEFLPLKRSQDSVRSEGRGFLKKSKDGISNTAVDQADDLRKRGWEFSGSPRGSRSPRSPRSHSRSNIGDVCWYSGDSGGDDSSSFSDEEKGTAPQRFVAPLIPCLSLERSKAEVQRLKIQKVKSLDQAMSLFCGETRLPECKELSISEMVCIFDVDGTLNNHPSPDEEYSYPYGQRDNSVQLVRTFQEMGGTVVFCSAYVESGDTLSFIREKSGFASTVKRLRTLGFTNKDLGVEEGDAIVKMDVQVQEEGKLPVKVTGYKYGAVVSCHRPQSLDGYFRGKLFAAAIAFPEKRHSWKLVTLIDDNLKGNLHWFVIDRKYNPYGTGTVTLLPIYLLPYKE